MPRALARTHPRWKSPYRAGLAQIAVLAVIVGGFAIAGLDPLLNLSTAMTGFGAVGLLSLMALTSASIAVLLWNRGIRGIAATVCPVLAAVGLAIATVLSISNYPDLTGSDSAVINALPWLHVPIVLGGLAVAIWLQRKRPAVYARLGSTRVEGPEVP